MRNLVLSSILAATVLFSFADAVQAAPRNNVSDAIALCRTTVAEQAGVSVDLARLEQARERPRAIWVDINLWSANNHLTNVRCEVTKGETLSIASISPPLNTATAQR